MPEELAFILPSKTHPEQLLTRRCLGPLDVLLLCKTGGGNTRNKGNVAYRQYIQTATSGVTNSSLGKGGVRQLHARLVREWKAIGGRFMRLIDGEYVNDPCAEAPIKITRSMMKSIRRMARKKGSSGAATTVNRPDTIVPTPTVSSDSGPTTSSPQGDNHPNFATPMLVGAVFLCNADTVHPIPVHISITNL